MRISHLGHSTLLVESDTGRSLIDPGTLTPEWENLTGLTNIFVTHAHPDHFDGERFPDLIRRNPEARVFMEGELAAGAGSSFVDRTFTLGQEEKCGHLFVRPVGGNHAEIHESMTPIGNVGLRITDSDGTVLYHPGDAIDTPLTGVDVLAVPIHGPWCSISDTVSFVNEATPDRMIPIHDGLLAASGRGLYTMLLKDLCPKTRLWDIGPESTQV